MCLVNDMDIKEFKGAIFDLDGTLLDSMHIWHDVDEEFFRRRNLKVTPEYIEVIKNMHLKAAAVYTKEKGLPGFPGSPCLHFPLFCDMMMRVGR